MNGEMRQIWERAQQLEFSAVHKPTHCEYAGQFQRWVDTVLNKVEREPSLIAVNQSKVALFDRYLDWLGAVPKAHRNRLNSSGHVCLYGVFLTCAQTLKTIELGLAPPPLFEALGQPTTSEKRAAVAGIYIAEEDEAEPHG